MILYDPKIPASITEFGIQIPIRDSRSTNTLAALLANPHFKSLQHTWHIDDITEKLTREDLERVHSTAYVERLFSDGLEKEIIATFELVDKDGNYHRYTPETATQPLANLFSRILTKGAATVQTARIALEEGFCFSFTGGAHHAQRDFGSGFCLLNDIVIAARKLQAEGRVKRVWVIDVDAHKGDGTAALTAGDDSISTLSIHMARGWPLDGSPTLPDGTTNPSFIASDIDIPIESGEEDNYLDRLGTGLARLEAMGTTDLAIVVCGADPYEHDELPSTAPLKLTFEQITERDRFLYNWLRKRDIPSAFLMAGGYGDKVWEVYSSFLGWVLEQRLRQDSSPL